MQLLLLLLHANDLDSTPEKHKKLDSLYRELMRNSESEKKVHDEEDIVSNIAILSAMKASDEPAPRNGAGKARKNQKQILESDIIADSPGPTPVEARGDVLKRVKGATQRSSSVASQNRTATTKEEVPEVKAPLPLQVGTEVFYRLQAADADEGVGQHQIIKRVVQEKKSWVPQVACMLILTLTERCTTSRTRKRVIPREGASLLDT